MGELNLEAHSNGIVSLFTGDVKDEAAVGTERRKKSIPI